MIPREKYIKAMEILEKEGWWQGGDYHAKDEASMIGAHCAIGALIKASGPGTLANEIEIALGESEYDLASDFIDFNDDEETSYTDVLTLLAFGAAGALD